MQRVEHDGRRRRARARAAAGAGSPRTPASSPRSELDEARAAGVDHAGLAQPRQLLGRAGERPLARCERRLERPLDAGPACAAARRRRAIAAMTVSIVPSTGTLTAA